MSNRRKIFLTIFKVIFLLLVSYFNVITHLSYAKAVGIDIEQQEIDKIISFLQCASNQEFGRDRKRPEPPDKYIKLRNTPKIIQDKNSAVIDFNFDFSYRSRLLTGTIGLISQWLGSQVPDRQFEYGKIRRIFGANRLHVTINYTKNSSGELSKGKIEWIYWVYKDSNSDNTATAISTIFDDDPAAKGWMNDCIKYMK